MSKIKPRLRKQNIAIRAFNKLYRYSYESPKRELLKNRMISLPPSLHTDNSLGFTLHMMVCKRDLKMAICSAMVMNLQCKRAFVWIFHDDGSLDDRDEKTILSNLPGSKVVRRLEADLFAEKALRDYPEILEYRRQQIMALKIIDVRIWGKGKKFGYVDSDILFFQRPDFYLDALSNKNSKNYFNKDLQSAYVQTPDQIEAFLGIRPFEKGNAGLWVMHREDINLDKIEEWLKNPGFAKNLYDYTLDQTFINLLANISPHGAEYLPTGYDVDYYKSPEHCVDKHYVGAIRHGYELEGLRFILNERDFANRWMAFAKGSHE